MQATHACGCASNDRQAIVVCATHTAQTYTCVLCSKEHERLQRCPSLASPCSVK